MRMKEDAMGTGQLKPAYNLQHGVDSGYITWPPIGLLPIHLPTRGIPGVIPAAASLLRNTRVVYWKPLPLWDRGCASGLAARARPSAPWDRALPLASGGQRGRPACRKGPGWRRVGAYARPRPYHI